MGQIPQDGENGQNVAFFFFEALLCPNGYFFSTFVNCSEEILSKAFLKYFLKTFIFLFSNLDRFYPQSAVFWIF